MSHAQAFNFLRQCRAPVVRSSASRRTNVLAWSAGARMGVRHYSEATAQHADAARSESSEKDEKESPMSEDCSATAEKLKAKEAEAVDLTGRLRYLQADFLNLQRNAAREKEQTRDFAITRFAGDLLETVDVLSLALKSVPTSALDSSASSSSDSPRDPTTSPPSSSETPSKSAQDYLNELHTGVEMTHRLLLQTLFKYGVKPFDPTGDKFDPNRHEALYQAPIPEKEPGTVIDCQKVGYTIKDRTLRAAQVGVAAET